MISLRGNTQGFIFGGVLLILFWIVFAPIQLGGPVSYVLINGISMEPNFHKGDLVLARTQNDYQVGDIVVYKHDLVGNVFHRIIDQSGDQFILKGDNNTWLDSYQPTSAEILGKLWLNIPQAGSVVLMLRTPGFMALIAIFMVASVFSASKNDSSRKSKRQQRSKQKMEAPQPKTSISENIEFIYILGAVALAGLFLGIFAFTRPLQNSVADNIHFQQIGVLLYQAPDLQNLYDNDRIQTGEPVFLQTTCDIEFFFGYQLVSSNFLPDEGEQISGVYQVKALISDPNGWNRSLELMPSTEFSGPAFSASMDLDLCGVRDLITEMEAKTGSKTGWYELAVYPDVTVQGTIDGRPVQANLAPRYDFNFNKLLMRLAGGTDETSVDNLSTVQSGVLPGSRLVLSHLRIFGWELPVVTARMIASIMLSVSVLGIVWLGWPLYREWKRGDASRIRVQYEPLLVDVQPGSISANGQAVPVDSFDDLAKLAERYGAMILCESNGELNKYWVQDGEVMYEYALDPSESGPETIESTSLDQEILDALKTDQFQLFYQPIVSTADGRIEAFEALLRWFHPEKGVIYPAEFIALAEELGSMELIDNWVIEEACKRLKTWKDNDILPVVISVNVSPYRFLDRDFVKWISKIIKRCGCDARYLQLEINRANRILDEEIAIANLAKLKKTGILLAIDNFAASNSNQVDSLTLLPVSSLKLDRKLINRILMKKDDDRLVGAVVKMAKDLGLHVVAEGVETQEQLDYLGEHQIDAAQGYFTGRPVPADEIPLLFAEDSVIGDQSAGG
jgi:signal peptidase I